MSNETKRSLDNEIDTKKIKRQRSSLEKNRVSDPNHAKDLLNELKHADPVLRMHLTKEDSPDITPSSKNLLKSILYPLSPFDFKTTCFRKKAVYIQSNRKDRAHDIITNYMFGLDSKQIFEETSSDSIFLWIPSNGKRDSSCSNTNEKKCLQSIDIQDPNTAHVLHTHSNYASYCRAPPELEQLLTSSMLRETGLGLGQYDPTGEKLTTLGRGEVETFIGTKGHVTDWHTDFQENFTIQLSGRKKWSLKQGTMKHPLRGTTPHYKSSSDVIENQIKAARLSNPDYQFGKQDLDNNAFGDEIDIIMDAGDVLYFPAGMWHKVETLEEGVSINISLMGTTYASLLCKTLEHALLEKQEWREVICSLRDTGCDVVENLKTLINDLPSVLEKLRDDGLAESILPPVLRHPPVFEVINEEIEDDQQVGGDGEKFRDDVLHGEKNGDSDGEANFSDSEEGSVQNEDEMIVDINGFEVPEGFESITPSQNHWKRNALASLMRMSDVKSFFETDLARGTSSEDSRNLYILNINFAGNEMHESTVRVVLKDGSGQLENFCSLRGENLDDAIKNLETPPSALIYYGYIV